MAERKKINAGILEYGKIPPQSIEIEEVVLGAIMLEKDAFMTVKEILCTDAFYKESHQKIYNAITILNRSSDPVDILTVTAKLRELGDLELIGGPYYITQLTSRIGSSANIEYHARIIMQKYLGRELIRISGELNNAAFSDEQDVFELLDSAFKQLDNLINSSAPGANHHISEATEESSKQLRKRIELFKTNKIIGIPTGLHDLDKMLGGWQPEVITIAARPSMGKTAFLLNVLKHCGMNGKTCKAYELEMQAVRLADRLILSETEIDIDKFRRGSISEYEESEFNEAKKKINSLPIYVDDRSGVNIKYIIRDLRSTKHKYPQLALAAIDHGGLLDMDSRNRNNEIGEIMKEVKTASKDLNIPIIVIFQLSRKVEDRSVKDKRPILADLRDSGNIEQDSDTVMFLYRPAYYNILSDSQTNESYEDYGEVVIAKRRDGSLGTVKFNHNKGLTKFFDYMPKDYAGPAPVRESVPYPDEEAPF